MDLLITFLTITILILFNALYVAAEFSTVSAKRPRLARMADEGNVPAQRMLAIVESPASLDMYVATCQIGITISSLVLGFLGQPQIFALLEPLLAYWGDEVMSAAQPIATVLILLFLTVLQVILGELIPKNVGIQYPEKLSLWTLRPIQWSIWVFRPLVWLFNGSGQLILRLIGSKAVAEHAHIHSPEEIQLLVEESSAGGILDPEERRLLVNTLGLRNLTARKAMIPRTQMLSASVELSAQELLQLLANSRYSWLPLYEGLVDHVVGIIHIKDLILLQGHRPQEQNPMDDGKKYTVQDIMHSVHYVPESLSVEKVLTQMQREHSNLLIVVDEYGGTAGMITAEDIFEEIIGDFEDEFDNE